MNAQGRNVILVSFLIQKHISKLHSSIHLEELFTQIWEEPWFNALPKGGRFTVEMQNLPRFVLKKAELRTLGCVSENNFIVCLQQIRNKLCSMSYLHEFDSYCGLMSDWYLKLRLCTASTEVPELCLSWFTRGIPEV